MIELRITLSEKIAEPKDQKTKGFKRSRLYSGHCGMKPDAEP